MMTENVTLEFSVKNDLQAMGFEVTEQQIGRDAISLSIISSLISAETARLNLSVTDLLAEYIQNDRIAEQLFKILATRNAVDLIEKDYTSIEQIKQLVGIDAELAKIIFANNPELLYEQRINLAKLQELYKSDAERDADLFKSIYNVDAMLALKDYQIDINYLEALYHQEPKKLALVISPKIRDFFKKANIQLSDIFRIYNKLPLKLEIISDKKVRELLFVKAKLTLTEVEKIYEIYYGQLKSVSDHALSSLIGEKLELTELLDFAKAEVDLFEELDCQTARRLITEEEFNISRFKEIQKDPEDDLNFYLNEYVMALKKAGASEAKLRELYNENPQKIKDLVKHDAYFKGVFDLANLEMLYDGGFLTEDKICFVKPFLVDYQLDDPELMLIANNNFLLQLEYALNEFGKNLTNLSAEELLQLKNSICSFILINEEFFTVADQDFSALDSYSKNKNLNEFIRVLDNQQNVDVLTDSQQDGYLGINHALLATLHKLKHERIEPLDERYSAERFILELPEAINALKERNQMAKEESWVKKVNKQTETRSAEGARSAEIVEQQCCLPSFSSIFGLAGAGSFSR